MDLIEALLLTQTPMPFWQTTLAICALFFVADALIMAKLSGQFKIERTHFILCLASIVFYIALYPLPSEVFRQYWMQILTALYLYDLITITRNWHQLKSGYRTFYCVHHGVSFCLFILWSYTFVPFTDAMALGALLWVSADIWRWFEQLWRLNGHKVSHSIRNTVDTLERCHRLLAYGIFLWVLDFEFKYTSEMILLASGITMDAIDTYFVSKTRSKRKPKKIKDLAILLNPHRESAA